MPDTLRSRPLRVLVADDNRDAADSLSSLLRLFGHEVSVAYDGQAALAVASEAAPDCMVLDIQMPRLDGYSVARLVRQDPALCGVKLIALSAFSDPEHERCATEAGFDHRLVKPAEARVIKELLAMLEQVMDLASRTKELAQENVQLARETKQVIEGAKAELTDVKEKIADVAGELREVKEELREVKDALRDQPAEGR